MEHNTTVRRVIKNKRKNFFLCGLYAQQLQWHYIVQLLKGLPSKRILNVLKVLKLVEIPKCLVLWWFSKETRCEFSARRMSNLFRCGFFGAEERNRYTKLSVLVSEALHVACNNLVLYNSQRLVLRTQFLRNRCMTTYRVVLEGQSIQMQL
jgi:hypothetical protein